MSEDRNEKQEREVDQVRDVKPEKDERLERIRAFFKGDHYATRVTGAEILEAEPGYARVGLTLDDRHTNAVGLVMGAVYYTMSDLAFAAATNAALAERVGREDPAAAASAGIAPSVTLGSSIAFLASAKGKKLYAECRAVRDGRRTGYYRTTVTDELGTLIAEITTTGYRAG